ncbi:similar to Saccharomyces cerevisiae YKL209C STE6 Plasma membrane ATP-binding cassette (ABC) transporter required for the export of a-factor, catalyzes ATP hydrolysis coupled to a-factor transport [Maudiozyma barnettii]|uniref:Similar to Saccharomyces cerevisiae YKL209C STE6 Plasma membrane ATP-binding cassette (ABC) transporter required for the export of a-factor, catalyzes ATP hydrolysis coupled to a-factor transport n=1 Tax=Maudiozyma barnettii TaxID=61262 RepID=A0A8H2VFU9_9SACH|nr:ATP-binding cassette a-factor transporter STE6 [Kazachstania barnettii]CAB4254742.1 similar to Saccharomyces cerevisiae YKL209C STE6 Plasma membrane ATP-binding cassette (ABC) transporter required for the export of a-factor, catalyzes ATP hydrolysis coupled to a-factor transport [Kazachstania barnettii]CAD1782785.1 similar to Saccharomyces cerevisiae YKL209C STE6 Plasma membrane ATP-binding cassette (ABC) transporter required for the export of a-factor, catalyzes ATP hydrolysis coupled to a-fa
MWFPIKHRIHIYVNIIPSKDTYIILLIIFSTVANGLVPAITSILTGRIFDLLTNISEFKLPKLVFKELTKRSMSIMALGAASLPVMWLSISCWMWIGEIQSSRLRKRLLISYINKPTEWYDKNENLLGDFVQLNRCIEEVRSSSAEASAITFQNMVAIISLIGVSFYYSWSLTLIILCSTPIIVALAVIFSRLINKYTQLENTESSKAAQEISFVMRAAQLVKLYGTKNEEQYKFMHLTQLCNTYFIHASLFVAANAAILRFLTLCMFIQGFWFGATMVRKGKLNIADVITCFHSCLMLGSTLSNTFHQIVLLQKGDVAIKKLEGALKSKNNIETVTNKAGTLHLSFPDASIIFKSVNFTYPSRPENRILNNLSLTFKAHETTFIVGKSGSGKSTLSNILLRLYNLESGSILIDNLNINLIERDELFGHITIVEQRCTLFNDTIRNNILLGSPDFKEESENNQLCSTLKKAIDFSLLNEFIQTLPKGLETKIGSEGITLSGGQQQRVALARAYMRDTPVLILDEAVSALDISHKTTLMKSIRSWRHNKTTVILSHHLADIGDDDYVYVMNEGLVAQEGSKHDLMNSRSGQFYIMNEVQNQYKMPISENNNLVSQGFPSAMSYTEESIILNTSTPLTTSEKSSIFHEKLSKNHTSLEEYELEQNEPAYISNDRRRLGDEEALDKRQILPLKIIIFQMIKTIRNKKLLFGGIMASLLAGATNPIFSYTFSYLLNGIVPGSQNDQYYLLKWSFIVLGVTIADGIFNFLKSFILGYCSENWIMDIRNDTMESIIHKNIYWYSLDSNKPSEISALLMNDLRDLRSLVSEFLSAMSTFLIVSLFGLIWALVSGWKLSLVCLSMFPLIVIFSSLYGGSLQQYETNYKSSVAKLENDQSEVLLGIKTIRYLKLQSHFLNNQRCNQVNMRQIAKGRTIVTGMGIAITNTLTMCIQAILYYYGLKLVLIGEYSSKRMFQTFTLLLFTIMTCTSLISQIPDIARGQRGASWIDRILKEDKMWSEDVNYEGRIAKIGDIDSNILVKINNLNYFYPSAPGVTIFNNLNLELANNKSFAIVGESGAGKSTLALLLTKLYKVPNGCIFLDQTDINDWNLVSLRSHIAMVEQTPVLIDDSLKNNLMYGNHNAMVTDQELHDILKFVGISEILEKLPKGLDSRISTDLVSGGQAQRLCLARAILRKPKILILDESTSALDAKSSEKIRQIVKQGLAGTLIISITHNKPMMECCDQIIVLKDGMVKEQGPYRDLNVMGSEFFRITSDLA